jgi:hypothetical protein
MKPNYPMKPYVQIVIFTLRILLATLCGDWPWE